MHSPSVTGARGGEIPPQMDVSLESLCCCVAFCTWVFLDTFLTLFRGVGFFYSHREVSPLAIDTACQAIAFQALVDDFETNTYCLNLRFCLGSPMFHC